MNGDKEVTLALAFMAVVFLGACCAMFYEEHENSVCKQVAITHNMPYLEIKELCQ
jgi:hypothetical protein